MQLGNLWATATGQQIDDARRREVEWQREQAQWDRIEQKQREEQQRREQRDREMREEYARYQAMEQTKQAERGKNISQFKKKLHVRIILEMRKLTG